MRWGAVVLAGGLLIAASAAAADQPICPDRPSKGTGTCTVPAGDWQIESGLVDWSRDTSGGARSDFTAFGSSLLKLGIGDDADVELGFTPYEVSRLHGPSGGERRAGFGDMLVRTKVRLTRDGASVEVAIDPFVKLPTAGHALGNGKVEGGLTVPVGVALGDGPLSLGFAPEVDWLSDGDGHGRHLGMIQVAGLGIAASPRLSLTAELWGQWDWDPGGTSRQYSADGAVAYLWRSDVQVDVGANLGLNRATPDLELYAGVSKRF
jgi:hypothetical protein